MRNLAFISLNALCSNAQAVRDKLSPSTKLCAVVKADAYGHGAEKCANALYKICDSFAVAIVEEGIRLRLSGVEKDILVLTPALAVDYVSAINHRLTLTIESAREMEILSKVAEKLEKQVKVHLKFDTGMHRFGADSLSEIKKIISVAKIGRYVLIDGVYSHLYDPSDQNAVESQRKKFLLANKLVKGYNSNATAHISASGGFLSGLEFDMVRIGILLYGYKPFPSKKVNIRPVMNINYPKLRERSLKKGESALYGGDKLKKDEDYYIVRYGYADGLPRRKTEELIADRCMDVTGVLGETKGSWACVLKNADELARKYGTISYEILTKAATRADRIYVT